LTHKGNYKANRGLVSNSVCMFVRPSVCHTGGSVKNGAS